MLASPAAAAKARRRDGLARPPTAGVGEEDDEDWQPRRKACRNSAVQPGAVVSGGKATKTGTVLARAQLQPAHGGVVAAQERRTALLAKGMFREAELLAQEGPVEKKGEIAPALTLCKSC